MCPVPVLPQPWAHHLPRAPGDDGSRLPPILSEELSQHAVEGSAQEVGGPQAKVNKVGDNII